MEVTGAKVILLEPKQPPRYTEYAVGATWWLLVATAARDESKQKLPSAGLPAGVGIQWLVALLRWCPTLGKIGVGDGLDLRKMRISTFRTAQIFLWVTTSHASGDF